MTKYRVEVLDVDYYRRQISCQNACPVHTDARGYVDAVADIDFQTGYIEARQPNPFASICGRVCAAHCEKACRRGKIDAPVTIRALKRFLCEMYGVEAPGHLPIVRGENIETGAALVSAKGLNNAATSESFTRMAKQPGSKKQQDTHVAVIGAGPAGLTAAHDLALMGHKVTVFEASEVFGGMVMLGIPEFRLPRNLLNNEVREILDLGVELRLNSALGRDFNLASLKEQGFQAIFIAIGAHVDSGLEVEGKQLDGVIPAVDFLLNVNLGYRADLGNKVAIIGGGDVAMDVARVAARLGDVYGLLVSGDLVTAMDSARSALRIGAREVHIVYRGTRQEMRASEEEIEGAIEEGVIIHPRMIPKRILGEGGKVTGLETINSRSIYDSQGRRTLEEVPGSEFVIECSSVILAAGQRSDLSFIQPEDGIDITTWGTIAADSNTLATSSPDIFAGGDAVYGPRTVIEAVADGHKAARGIDNYLSGGRWQIVRRGWLRDVTDNDLPDPEDLHRERVNPEKVSLERRTGVSEVETVYELDAALTQARRCLKCNIQTVFNGELCILCGACVDICPRFCYKMVSLDMIQGDENLETAVMAKYGKSLEELQMGGEVLEAGTAMIKDETSCIRCGLCAKRCPTGAITMKAFWFEEELVNHGDENNENEGVEKG